MNKVPITYFSDALCIWAYISEARIQAVRTTFAEAIDLEIRFCSVFGSTASKIRKTWGQDDGYERFNRHLLEVAARFPELKVAPTVWLATRPASSMAAHVYLKAVQLAEAAEHCPARSAENMIKSVRRAFFEHARDISCRAELRKIADQLALPSRVIEAIIDDGRAFAALSSDYQDADSLGVEGSPTFVFNDGRQKLYGNVGFHIIEANIRELIREPHAGQASWC